MRRVLEKWLKFYHSPAFIWFVLVCGAVIRIISYLKNRPLDRDEAIVVIKVLDSTIGTLLDPVHGRQGDPLGYLALLRMAVVFLGRTEFALRLPSLLLSLAALGVFVKYSRVFLPVRLVPMGCVLFAASSPAIWFASSAKQYQGDLLITMIISLLFLSFSKGFSSRMIVAYCCAAAAVWFSYPVVFLAAGFTTYYGIRCLTDRDWKSFSVLSGGVSLFLLSFFICFKTSMTGVVGTGTHFYDHWSTLNSYPPNPFNLPVSFNWYAVYCYWLFVQTGRFFTPIPVFLLALVGVAVLAKKSRHDFFVLLLPVLWLFAAGLMHYYPFPTGGIPKMARLVIFLVPNLIVFFVLGIDWFADRISTISKLVSYCAICFFLLQPVTFAVRGLFVSGNIDEVRQALEVISKQKQIGDLLYAVPSVAIFHRYYREHLDLSGVDTLWTQIAKDEPLKEQEEFTQLRGRKRVWIILRATKRVQEVQAFFDTKGQRVLSRDFVNCWLMLYDFSSWR